MSVLELYWREQPDGGVASLTVVPDLELFEDCVRQLDSCVPAFPVRGVRPAFGSTIEVLRRQVESSQFVRPGDLVFDIGANMGNRIEAFVALGASVVAVEPQGSCVASLRRLYRNQPDVVVVAAGAR
jgi:hypothetical protein